VSGRGANIAGVWDVRGVPPDSAITVTLLVGELGRGIRYYRDYDKYVIHLRRRDWRLFEWGGEGLKTGE
jgi:hypothetical protein